MEYNRVHFPSGKSCAWYESSSHFGEKKKKKREKWHGEGRQSQETLVKAAMTSMILSRRIFVITVIIVQLQFKYGNFT